MSSALAIAGVTTVLRNLLNSGLIDHQVIDRIGYSAKVSVGPPDRVTQTNSTESSQLNLFMYRITSNTGWCNEGLPSRDASGSQRLTNVPLALNLHYLLSAYGSEELHGEILLGYAMQLLHETPVLSRKAIQKALSSSVAGTELTPAMKSLADSGLENQIEQIKITPEYLNTEEISKLWTATQSHLRPTAAYMASVVLIEAREPARSPLPVLTRGPVLKPKANDQSTWYERGIVVEPGLVPPSPMLESLIPDGKQPVAQIDTTVEITGHCLGAKPGTTRKVRLANDRFKLDKTIDATDPPSPKTSAGSMLFSIPADFPVGIYSVSALLQPPDEDSDRETNRVAMTLAPTITSLSPSSLSNSATLRVELIPAVVAGQEAVLVLGQQEFSPQVPAEYPARSLDFIIKDAPASPAPGLLARLRIDGIESPIIDRSVTPPAFFDKRVIIT